MSGKLLESHGHCVFSLAVKYHLPHNEYTKNGYSKTKRMIITQ
jgi:hypothetical protein